MVQLVHEVRLAEMEIDRALVDGGVRALAFDEAEQLARGRVHDRERVRGRRAERRARRRIVGAGPHEAGLRSLELR